MNRKALLLLIPLVSIMATFPPNPATRHLEFRSAGRTAGESPAPPASKDDPAVTTAEKVFKNIQVLKGHPADQIYPTMQFINESLGVSCEYCHDINAYEKDDKKPKQAARRMIRIQNAINKDHFGGRLKVTCYSCHRGSVDVPQR